MVRWAVGHGPTHFLGKLKRVDRGSLIVPQRAHGTQEQNLRLVLEDLPQELHQLQVCQRVQAERRWTRLP